MKIRYLLLHAYGVGGTIRSVFHQANAFAADHEVEVVSVIRKRETPAFELDPRVRLTPLVDTRQQPKRFRHPVGMLQRTLSGRTVPADEDRAADFNHFVERQVARYLKTQRSGVVIGTRPALNLLMARHAPPELTRIAQDHMNLRHYKPQTTAQIGRWYPRLDAVVTLTDTDRDDYVRALAGSGVPVIQIPNALPPSARPRATLDNKVVIAAGRLVRQKGFDQLIDAFAEVAERHPDWRLRIFGNGRLRNKLSHQVDRLGLGNVVSLRAASRRLDRELAKASLLVVSSRFEGLPMVIVEAMSQGLPVVAFDCHTGPAEIITHGRNGLLVPPGDVAALAKAIIELIEDPARLQRFATHAPEAVAPYDLARIRQRWEALFDACAARNGVRA